MAKKLALLFLVTIFAGLLLPLVSLADGTYTGVKCLEEYVYDSRLDKCCKKGDCSKAQNQAVAEKKIFCYDGFVPCGKKVWVFDTNDPTILKDGKCNVVTGTPETNEILHCQLCHFFVLIDGIIDYFLIYIVPPITVLMIVVGGVMFYMGGTRPEMLGKGKTLIKSVVIGLVLIYGAYIFVNLFLVVLGAAKVNPVNQIFSDGIFSVSCPIQVPETVWP